MASARRADIQGLRALAVLAVVAYHVRPAWLPGGFAGVDIFFVISGFLITSGLMRDVALGRVRLTEFWGRRIRRLMPAATVVLVATLLASAVLLPEALRGMLSRHALASAVSGENWLLASDAVSYLHATTQPSPFQHFWSLSVEEQFYVVWPLLVAAVLAVAIRLRRSPTHALGAVAVVVALVSLAWSVRSSAASPDVAYLSTLTRAWELLLGASLAIWLPDRSLRPAVARPVLAAGLVLLVGSVLLLDGAMPFPGWVALAPTVGAACVLAAGATPFTSVLRRPLEWRPVTWVGDVSYSLYLWHWPVVVLLGAALGTAALPWYGALAAVLGSLVLAGFSKRFVEDAFLRPPRPRGAQASRMQTVRRHPFALGAAMLGLSGAALAVVHVLPVAPPPPAAGPDAYVGGRVLDPDGPSTPLVAAPPTPTLAELQASIEPQLRQPCLQVAKSPEVTSCEAGDPAGRQTVLVAGDSHAAMWMPVFDDLGATNGWRVVVAAKQSCPLVDLADGEDTAGPVYRECREWNDNFQAFARDLRPDLVVTSAANYAYEDGSASGPESYDRFAGLAYGRQYTFLEGLGSSVLAVPEVPYFPGFSPPTCLSLAGATADACSTEMSAARVDLRSRIRFAAEADPALTVVDVAPYLCPTDCRAVIGNVVTYRDDNHLTPQFAASLDWVFERALRADHPELFVSRPAVSTGS